MKLRAAIAGAGLMGSWHAQSIADIGAEVVTVLDINSSAAMRLATQFKGAHTCSSATQLFDGGKFDVLHICTPAASHFELGLNALENGVHVLIEKPMTPAARETEQLYELAANRQLLICPVHQFLFQRGVEQARRALPSIGKLLHFGATFCSAGAEGKNAANADSVVADILPHPLSLLELFAPKILDSSRWSTHWPCAGELRTTLFRDDLSCWIFISTRGRPTTASLLLVGTCGTIHLDLFHGFRVIEPGAVSRRRKIVHPFDLAARTFTAATVNLTTRAFTRESAYPGLRKLISLFYKAVLRGDPLPVRPEDASAVAKARDKILRHSALVPDAVTG